MTTCDSEWRGLGIIPMSGMILRDEYADFDARKKFSLPKITGKPNPACRCGDVLQGKVQAPQTVKFLARSAHRCTL